MTLNTKCCFAECHICLIIMLYVVKLNIIVLSVLMQNVIIMGVVMLTVVAPLENITFNFSQNLFSKQLTKLKL
jgi:hypothetical protein